MIKSNFLKKVYTAATFLQNFNDFEPNLDLWKTDILTLFQKSISQSISILPIVSHSHFQMGFNHLSSTALQNKTIIVQLPMIDICFWDFQNCAKNGDSVPLTTKWSSTTPVSVRRYRQNWCMNRELLLKIYSY